LVKNNQGKCQHHLFVFIPFGFKPPFILELVIIILDNTISHIIPTSYSYWCSHLNLMTHITKSYNHFLYIVDLDTKGYTVSRLCTRPRFPKTQTRYTWGSTLSYESRIKWTPKCNGSASWETEVEYTSGIPYNL